MFLNKLSAIALLCGFIVCVSGCVRNYPRQTRPQEITDPGMRKTCIEEARQVLAILREEGFQAPDVGDQEPQKIFLWNEDKRVDQDAKYRIEWSEKLIVTLTSRGEVESIFNLEPVAPQKADMTTATTAQNGLKADRFELTTSTLHERDMRLLKRLKPITWQNYKWSMVGYYECYVNGLALNSVAVSFCWDSTRPILKAYVDSTYSGTFPSMADLKIDEQQGAKIAMHYLRRYHGLKAQMIATNHEMSITNLNAGRRDGWSMELRFDNTHLRLCHGYVIFSQRRPFFRRPHKGYYIDIILVDAVEGKVVGHGHRMLVVSDPPKPKHTNFYLARYPE